VNDKDRELTLQRQKCKGLEIEMDKLKLSLEESV